MQEQEITLETDLRWMGHALSLARKAQGEGEVPVGAVIVLNGEPVGEGWNRNITLNDPSAHAEIIALRNAGRHLQNYRLPGCVMYVTLEPCAMCVGAIVQARIERVVFGAYDSKAGALGSAIDLTDSAAFNHRFDVQGGVLSDECSAILQEFFAARR